MMVLSLQVQLLPIQSTTK